MMSKYTAGKWVAEKTRPWRNNKDVINLRILTELKDGYGGRIICNLSPLPNDEMIANARIIAASPQMYDYILHLAKNGTVMAMDIIKDINPDEYWRIMDDLDLEETPEGRDE